MKAVLLSALNKDLEVCNVDLTDLKFGQVLVRVLVSGICGAQLHEISGFKGNGKFLPHLMGHEGCGIVEEIGQGVSFVKPGDKVVMHWREGAGLDSEFPKYVRNGSEFSSGKINTLAEYVIVSENRLTTIPNSVNSELAALLGCSLSTALSTIDREVNLRFGESVAILGCGGVGLNLITAARLKGSGEIWAVERSMKKRSLCLSQGATHFHSSIEEIESDFDVIIDTTGDVNLIARAFLKLSKTGRMILLGQPMPSDALLIKDPLKFFSGNGVSLGASQGGSTVPHLDIPRYLKLIQIGVLNVNQLITHRFSLDEINEAIMLLRSGNAGRIMVKISDE